MLFLLEENENDGLKAVIAQGETREELDACAREYLGNLDPDDGVPALVLIEGTMREMRTLPALDWGVPVVKAKGSTAAPKPRTRTPRPASPLSDADRAEIIGLAKSGPLKSSALSAGQLRAALAAGLLTPQGKGRATVYVIAAKDAAPGSAS